MINSSWFYGSNKLFQDKTSCLSFLRKMFKMLLNVAIDGFSHSWPLKNEEQSGSANNLHIRAILILGFDKDDKVAFFYGFDLI